MAETDTGRTALLQHVVDLDGSLWASPRLVTLQERDDAVKAALMGGWSTHDIAAALRVLPDDVARWARGER